MMRPFAILLTVQSLVFLCGASLEKQQEDCVTVLQLHKPKVHWIIRNFDLFMKKDSTTDVVKSPLFYNDPNGHWVMSASLWPTIHRELKSTLKGDVYNYGYNNEQNMENVRYWHLEVDLNPTNKSDQVFVPPTSIQAAILGGNPDQKGGTVLEISQLSLTDYLTWEQSKFIKADKLIQNIQTYAPGNDLIIQFEITQESSVHLVHKKDTKVNQSNQKVHKHSGHMDGLLRAFEQEKWTDLKLRSREGSTISVHKVVLAAASPVFEELVGNVTADVMDVDSSMPVLRELLHYLYSGSHSYDIPIAELFVIADRYKIPALKENCELILCDQVTIATVADLLVLAETHNAAKLKSFALDFIVGNFKEVSKTTSWKQTLRTHPEITVDSIMTFLSKMSNN